ncbi:hypothetical protein [Micromonospora sp. NBC_01796]|uniref:hypothetical protein n=1 Tax=Micromonospora sp. NBC_01796 TaxID=2975987 RepID=UPI002DDA7B0A|nr:hypothetical protein [Micromonospora sp. NBC_01796]WSA87909.1 hypothetical protein OIE47_10050 [Micromonospora sp. NBC_01796]
MGEQIVDLVVKADARQLTIVSDAHTIEIDLAWTGTVIPLRKDVAPWRLSDGIAMPTVRLVFDDGTGIDFREPAKTKRITVSVRVK